MGQVRYRVYFTPLASPDSNTYGTELDVSDRIRVDGIGSIKKTIDANDYDIGAFVFSDLTLKGFNYNGYFNDESDIRSIFTVTRDRAKVRIEFEKVEIERNSSGVVTSDTVTSTITFRGIINEEGTRVDPVSEEITFKVLSRDSVLRTTRIPAGIITNGTTAKSAMLSVLSQPKITSVLNISDANINPDYNFTIDVGSAFDNKTVKEMLDQLIFASNSVMFINDAGDVIIKDRTETTSKDVVNLYGKSDEQGRENIINITNYNSGKHRMFTSVVINDTEESNPTFALAFGFRQKKITLDFITDTGTESVIGERLVDEFKFPKVELQVTVSTDVSKGIELFDRVSINYPLRVKPMPGKFLPVIGVTKIGETDQPLPDTYGSISIPPRFSFKVIEIQDDPTNFTSTIKLRQTGKSFEDGYFDNPASSIVGFAVIGVSKIGGTDDPANSYNPSALGAAIIGLTRVA